MIKNLHIRKLYIGCLLFMMCIAQFIFSTVMISAEETPEIVSKYAYVLDLHNDSVILEKNAEAKMYPASLTKIMTVLVALEAIEDLDDSIVMKPEIFEGLKEAEASVAGYRVGDEAVLKDLLYGIMLPSGADASRAIAYYVAGSEASYVELMNTKANELGLKNTHFVNTSGLHDENHYSTAKDMGMLLQYALKNEIFKEIFSTDVYTTQAIASHPEGITLYATRVRFLQEASLPNFLSGSKTGYTHEAGLCLAATIEEEGMNFMVITGNAGDDVENAQHIKDAYHVYTYLENTYLREKLFSSGEVVGEMPIKHGEEDNIPVLAQQDVYVLKSLIDQSYMITWDAQNNTAPIEDGELLGQAIVSYDGVEVERFDVMAQRSMEQSSLFKFITFLTSVPAIVSGIILLLIGMIAYRWIRQRDTIQ